MRVSTKILACFTLALSSCFAEWIRASHGFLPPKSLVGGFDVDNQDLYICRADGVNGKFSKKPGVCRYPWRGHEVERNTYEILTDVHGVWAPVTPPNFPTNQLMTSVSNGNPVYSCRVHYVDQDYNRSLTIGKVDGGKAFIGYAQRELKCGKDLSCDNYEVFTAVPNIPKASMVYELSGQYLTFKVSAEGEVYILLGIHNQLKYKLTIGAMSNTVTSIGKIRSPNELVVKSETILDQFKMKAFWLRWTSQNILEFGIEGQVKPLLSYNKPGVHEIDSVEFAPVEGNQWQIPGLLRV